MDDTTQTPTKKRKWYTQSFKKEWLTNPEFGQWLQQDKNDSDASYCKCCNAILKNANKTMLIKHMNTAKHKSCFSTSKSSVNITQFMSKKKTTESEQAAKSELLFAGYFAEHNIPFSNVDHLFEICKKAFPDSNIAKNISMKRTKLSYVIQDGIAFHEKMLLTDICRTQKFSIIIDESTDISVTQILAVVVRYFDATKHDVVDVLLETIVVENGTALGLYTAVKSMLQEKNIPLENIVGFGSDNCSSMMGTKNGFQKLLKNDVPSVFIMGCVCHSFALCASHAVSVLPSYLEAFLKDLTSYFSRSSKRQRDFTLIQEVTATACHKIPKLAQTRWLSRETIITAILEQFDALLLYFQAESEVDKVDGAKKIYDVLNNRGTKHILFFLQYVLQKINLMNVEFQSEHFRLHILYSMVSSEYKIILSFFIKNEVLNNTKLSEIDPNKESNFKSVIDVYLGGKAMAQLINDPLGNESSVKRFKTDCLKFLVELSNQIRKRFNFSEDGVIAKLNVLDPKVAHAYNTSPTSIIPLAIHFPSVVPESKLNDLDDQWRSYSLMADELLPSIDNIPEYWYKLRNIRDGFDNPKYDVLSNFMTTLTILPHSSACVERIFSQVNCIKTRNTNSLKADTVRDRMLAKQLITRKSLDCTSWDPEKTLIKNLEEGAVSRRYLERIKRQKENNESVTIRGAAAEEEEL